MSAVAAIAAPQRPARADAATRLAAAPHPSPAARAPLAAAEESAHVRRIRAFVTLLLEVEAGLRPARHLRRIVAPQAEHALRPRPGRPPEIRRIVVQARAAVCEAVVLLDDGARVHALAVALRRDEQGWVVVDLRRPDSPPPPPPPEAPEELADLPTRIDLDPADARPRYQVPAGWGRRAA